MVTKVYLIRHAEAMGNINETFQGRTDENVTEKGYKQLAELSKRFKDISLDVIYSSPLVRAKETAKAVDKYHGIDVSYDEGLIEINGGVWEGKKWADLPTLYPVEFNLWTYKMHEFYIENGETMAEVSERMQKTIGEIVSQNLGKSIAIVSHGCAIRTYLCYASGNTLDKLHDVGWSDNTSVSLIEYGADLTPNLVYKNNSDHLPYELSTLAFSNWCKSENGEYSEAQKECGDFIK